MRRSNGKLYSILVFKQIFYLLFVNLVFNTAFPFAVLAEVLDRVIASIDGAPVTESEIIKELTKISPTTPINKPIDSQSIKAGLTGILLEKEAIRMGVTVSKEEIDQQIAMVIERSNISTEQFEKSLAEAGMSMDQYRDKIANELNRSRVVGTILKQRIQVSDEELGSYISVPEDSNGDQGEQFGLLKLTLLVKDIDQSMEAEKLAKYLKEGGVCENYKSAVFIGCENLGVFKLGDLKDTYSRSLDGRSNYEFGELIEENSNNYYLLKIDSDLSKKNSNVGQDIREKLFQEKFKVEAEKFLSQEIFEKYSVEMHF